MLHPLARYPLRGSPPTLSVLVAVTALVAALLPGTQDAAAGIVIHGNPRR